MKTLINLNIIIEQINDSHLPDYSLRRLEQSMWVLIEKGWITVDVIGHIVREVNESITAKSSDSDRHEYQCLLNFSPALLFISQCKDLIEDSNDKFQRSDFEQIIASSTFYAERGAALLCLIERGLIDEASRQCVLKTQKVAFLESLEQLDPASSITLTSTRLMKLETHPYPDRYLSILDLLNEVNITLTDEIYDSVFHINPEFLQPVLDFFEPPYNTLFNLSVWQQLCQTENYHFILGCVLLKNQQLDSDENKAKLMSLSCEGVIKAIIPLKESLTQPIFDALTACHVLQIERSQVICELIKEYIFKESMLPILFETDDIENLLTWSVLLKNLSFLNLLSCDQALEYFCTLTPPLRSILKTFLSHAVDAIEIKINKEQSPDLELYLDFDLIRNLLEDVFQFFSQNQMNGLCQALQTNQCNLFSTTTIKKLISIYQHEKPDHENAFNQFLGYLLITRTNVERAARALQNTHAESIHASTSETIKNLQQHYGPLSAVQMAVIHQEILSWSKVDELGNLDPKTITANNIDAVVAQAVVQIQKKELGASIDPVSECSLGMVFALVWHAIRDDSQRIGSQEDALGLLKKEIYLGQRNYNLDRNNRDNGGLSDPECASGAFNRIVGVLNGIHPLARQVLMTQQSVLDVFVVRVREKVLIDFQQRFTQCTTLDEINNEMKLIKTIQEEESIAPIWDRIKEETCHDFWIEFSTTGYEEAQAKFKSFYPSEDEASFKVLCNSASYINFNESRPQMRLKALYSAMKMYKIKLLYQFYLDYVASHTSCKVGLGLLLLTSISVTALGLAFLISSTSPAPTAAAATMLSVGVLGTILSIFANPALRCRSNAVMDSTPQFVSPV
ncbi:MAG: hypothetical protein NTW08_00650 [Gammaproteobacteria bacterium]|nr:hypothetical protein [Gammaproteobacteria bacterium]